MTFQKRLCRLAVSIIAILSPLLNTHKSADAVELVRDGKAVATIVVPANPLPVESYAAKELQYHVKTATGVELPIADEAKDAPDGRHLSPGRCKATAAARIDPSALPGNGYIVKTVGDDLFIAGNDSSGDPLGLDTHEGTLFEQAARGFLNSAQRFIEKGVVQWRL
jgi:hypothetical protein